MRYASKKQGELRNARDGFAFGRAGRFDVIFMRDYLCVKQRNF